MGEPLGKIAVAIDTLDWETFERWTRLFGPRVGYLKVGLAAFTSWGPRAVEVARASCQRVFLDLKLHDIPSTVSTAVSSVRDLGVDLLTVHVSGGREMLRAAVGAARGETKVLGVTVLTHLDREALRDLDLGDDPEGRARAWARKAQQTGCSGAVCSPREVVDLRKEVGEGFLLVTPGIRWGDELSNDDQQRVATPSRAIESGADLLVIGRPLTGAVDPAAALDRLETALAGG